MKDLVGDVFGGNRRGLLKKNDISSGSGKSGRATGPCCMGSKCMYPMMELCPRHTCPGCNVIVHVLCGEFHVETDKYFCFPCLKKKVRPSPSRN